MGGQRPPHLLTKGKIYAATPAEPLSSGQTVQSERFENEAHQHSSTGEPGRLPPVSCFYPLAATQLAGGSILVHSRTPGLSRKPTPPHLGRDIKLPCNQCIGCKMQRSQEWALRCLHESQLHTHNSFLTLTIAEENMALAAPGGSLSRYTHQTFTKRLRSKLAPRRISYYMCGEYGERLLRPHYHYLVFGYDFPDKVHTKTSHSGEKLYESPTLNLLWPHGKAWIGQVTYESCAYVASYVMKKLNGKMAEEHYLRQDEGGNNYWLEPEFNEMSRRPAIAKSWWERYRQDVTTDDHIVKTNGGEMQPPRYYDKLLKLFDPTAYAVIKMKREHRAQELTTDNTPSRLAAKEIVLQAKISLKHRNLEHKHENDTDRNLRPQSSDVHQS